MVPFIYVYLTLVCFGILNMVLSLMSILGIPCFGYAYWMDFYGFVDGSCRHTLNIASVAWVLYSPTNILVSSGAVCIGLATSNIVECQAMIGLLTEATSRDIHDLVVFMESQLVVFHMNLIYSIRNPTLLHLFRRVHLLEMSFESITYRHIPRSYNTVAYSLATYILDWYISHT